MIDCNDWVVPLRMTAGCHASDSTWLWLAVAVLYILSVVNELTCRVLTCSAAYGRLGRVYALIA